MNQVNWMHSISLLMLAALSGCSALSSQTQVEASRFDSLQDDVSEQGELESSGRGVKVVRGRPNRLIDGLGDIVGLPNRIAIWNRGVSNHKVSARTEDQLVDYLESNNLDSTLVRVNQYDPIGEWKRLATNDQIGFGWRSTFGAYNMFKYTLIPGRIGGGDWYNPYTNTVNLYSDVPALALTSAAYAKDVAGRSHPGAYAALQDVPVIGIQADTLATEEVLHYSTAKFSAEEASEYREVLAPAYGATVGAQLVSFLPYGSLIGRLGGAAVGHVTNSIQERRHSPDAALADSRKSNPKSDHPVTLVSASFATPKDQEAQSDDKPVVTEQARPAIGMAHHEEMPASSSGVKPQR
ncbi:MAG: hypothetical protein ABJZ55_08630 [Fuerstiella sp.]